MSARAALGGCLARVVCTDDYCHADHKAAGCNPSLQRVPEGVTFDATGLPREA